MAKFLVLFALWSPIATLANDRADLALSLIVSDFHLTQQQMIATAEAGKRFRQGERDYIELQIRSNADRVGPARLLMSGPVGFLESTQRRPVVFVSAGFFSGMASIQLIQSPANSILVGYEYPTTSEKIQQDPSQMIEAIRQVPAQITAALLWLREQKFVDAHRLYFLSASLGTLFAPVSLRLAQKMGVTPSKTALTFGGAEVGDVIANHFSKNLPPAQQRILADIVNALVALQDPRLHIPYLQGPFLVIRGAKDEIFPERSGRLLESLLPSPKTVEVINTPHIDPSRPDVIEQTMTLVRRFFEI